jgi:hypothetical protein
MGDDLFIDCAVYGMKNNGDEDASQRLEQATYDLDGMKALIGRNHYSPERFWEIYDKDHYAKAKAELDPTGTFADLYAKLGNTG